MVPATIDDAVHSAASHLHPTVTMTILLSSFSLQAMPCGWLWKVNSSKLQTVAFNLRFYFSVPPGDAGPDPTIQRLANQQFAQVNSSPEGVKVITYASSTFSRTADGAIYQRLGVIAYCC